MTLVFQCQICGTLNAQEEDADGLPTRPPPCPRCEATARIAAADLPHLGEARRLYLALAYVTAALDHCLTAEVSADWRRYYPDQARHYDRVVSRAVKLMAELEHLAVRPDERRRNGGADAETDEAPTPGHGPCQGEAGEHRPEARSFRGNTG